MKKLGFGKILLIYAGIFMVIIIAVCIVVWNKLEVYQKDYDKAKALGDPSIFAEELVANWNLTAVEGYIDTYGVKNLGVYNDSEALAEHFAGGKS